YYAPSVESAIKRARQELSEEAMLLDSRTAPDEVRHLDRYEVVFALPETSADRPTSGETRNPPQARTEDMATMRREMVRIHAETEQSNLFSRAMDSPFQDSELARMYASLRAADVTHGLATDLLSSCLRQPIRCDGNVKPHLLDSTLREQMFRR